MLRKDRVMQKGGGVACFYKKSISIIPIQMDIQNDFFDILTFDVKSENGFIRFCVVYFPPNHTENNEKILKEKLNEISDTTHEIFIIGDFNKPNINWENPDIHNSKLAQFCVENGMYQVVDEPTRGENILDLLFCSNPALLEKIQVKEPFANSDHNSIIFDIFWNNLPFSEPVSKNFFKADYDSIKAALSIISWRDTFSVCANVEEFWQIFSAILNSLIEKFVPLRGPNPKSKNFISKDFKKLLSKKRRLWKKLKHKNHPITRKNYNECLRNIKIQLFNIRTEEEKGILRRINHKTFFNFVNSHLNLKESVPVLVNNDEILTADSEKAKFLNEYFISVFTEDDNILPNFEKIANSELKNCIFTPEMVRKSLNALKPCFSSGPDKFPAHFLKKLSFYISEPLSIIFEVSFRTHKLPNDWLRSNVVPVHKKGAKTDVKNYRPISLTCVCCRIMESLVKKRITQYLTENQYLSVCQYGFRSHSSTCSQLLHCTNLWSKSIDSKKPVDIVYFDFAKAFDTVCHKKLLLKLNSYGIKGDIFEWIKAFLSNRKQRVIIKGNLSEENEVISGVPQGSVLGPLLFLIFINDLPNILPKGINCVMFADDLKIFCEVSSESQHENIQKAIDAVYSWSKTWQLSLSVEKCSVLHLGKNNLNKEYILNTKILKTDSSVRDLGIQISSDGKFSEHIRNIVINSHRRLSLIFKIFRSQNPELLLKAYKVYVRPILEYCCPVWSPFYLKDISALEKVQKRFTRKIFGRSKSYVERLAIINLESLEERRIKIDIKECFKHVNLPEYRKDFFQKTKNKYNTENDLYVEFARTDLRKYWFSNRSSKYCNNLPNELKNCKKLLFFAIS
jgi:Reverse transcriptase (RNA-dependent DNA polymerase)/Endonuclease-reverse transcriptase